MAPTNLPVNISNFPHWRINIRPSMHNTELIPNLNDCINLIEKTQVRYRGWPYPFLSNKEEDRDYGDNWIGSRADFRGHVEYWRLYQSGQFIHLNRVKEHSIQEWHKKLLETAKQHPSDGEIDWAKVPGFINITNCLYTVTEIVEFLYRLFNQGVYENILLQNKSKQPALTLSIELRNIKGFMLTTDWNRAWYGNYTAKQDVIGHEWNFSSTEIIGESTTFALDITIWLLQRFGWLSPSKEVLKQDQENFIKGRY